VVTLWTAEFIGGGGGCRNSCVGMKICIFSRHAGEYSRQLLTAVWYEKLARRTIVLRFTCLVVFTSGKRLLASSRLSLCQRVRHVHQAEFYEISYFEFFTYICPGVPAVFNIRPEERRFT
jgi:hypothetical protein